MTTRLDIPNPSRSAAPISRRSLLARATAIGLGGASLIALERDAFAGVLGPIEHSSGHERSASTASTPVANGGAVNPAETLTSESFSEASVDATIAAFAGIGIAVFEDSGSSQPMVPVEGQLSPVRFVRWQVHNLALEIANSGGISGADLDALVPDQSTQGVPPPSYLLAGYLGGAKTPGSELARNLMGDQDLYDPPSLQVPALVLSLFASDVAIDAGNSIAGAAQLSAKAGPLGASVSAAEGICTSIQQFVDKTIDTVFNLLETQAEKAVEAGGGLLNDIWNWINQGLEKLKAIAKWVAKQLTAPVLKIIRSVAGVLAIAGQVVATLQPWSVKMLPDPPKTRFGVDAEEVAGSIKATVNVGLIDDWPPDLLDCAHQSGVDLPPFRPAGDPITWTLKEAPIPLAQPTDQPPALDDTASATFGYVTNDEPAVVAKGEEHSGQLIVMARVNRPEIEKLKGQLIQLLFAQLPDIIARILQPILGPKIAGLLDNLTGILAGTGSTTVIVVYHTPVEPTEAPTSEEASGCVTGTWNIAGTPVTGAVEGSIPVTGGRGVVTFGADGTFSVEYDEMTVELTVQGASAYYAFSGESNGSYSVEDGTLSLTVSESSQSYILTTPAFTRGPIVPGELGIGHADILFATYDYEFACEGDGLTLKVSGSSETKLKRAD